MNRRTFIAGLGSAAVWPVVGRAQQATMPVIGYLTAGSESAVQPLTSAFRRGLEELGYLEGQNVRILYRWAEARYERLPELATDLVRLGSSVIVATGGNVSALAAKSATSAIPIVFVANGDPVGLGLVASLNRPGGNITGATFLGQPLNAKRLEVLREIVPAATTIAVFVNPTNPQIESQVTEAESAARILGVRLSIVNVTTPSEIDLAFQTFAGLRIDGLMTGSDPLFFFQRDQMVALAARYSIPAIFGVREFVEAGGLASYGTSISDAWRLVGGYTGQILKGEKPANLPVQQPTKVEFVLNMKVANALGLKIPLPLLGRADEVIE